MARCAYCDLRVGERGVRPRKELFCSRGCARRRHPPEFCDDCRDETSSESTGTVSTFNGVGRVLVRVREEPCPECGSELARVWLAFGFPIVPLSTYRVLWIDEPWYFGAAGSWIARRVR